jgi:hypothetical protein
MRSHREVAAGEDGAAEIGSPRLRGTCDTEHAFERFLPPALFEPMLPLSLREADVVGDVAGERAMPAFGEASELFVEVLVHPAITLGRCDTEAVCAFWRHHNTAGVLW